MLSYVILQRKNRYIKIQEWSLHSDKLQQEICQCCNVAALHAIVQTVRQYIDRHATQLIHASLNTKSYISHYKPQFPHLVYVSSIHSAQIEVTPLANMLGILLKLSKSEPAAPNTCQRTRVTLKTCHGTKFYHICPDREKKTSWCSLVGDKQITDSILSVCHHRDL